MYGHILPRAIFAPQRRPSLLHRLDAAAAHLVDGLLDWRDRVRSRRLLGTLDERQLRDIGLDRATAEREAEIPFWR
jgi:uncharacterized protein YjiS (DUF1127 family)